MAIFQPELPMRYPFPSTLLLLTLIPALAAAQTTSPDLSDPEVAHVAVTANNIDIDLGKLALSRTKDSEVKNFASMMVRDHTGVNEKAVALATKLGVTPKDNAVSQSLEAGAKDAKAKLDPLKGADFDRAYIEREITYHQAVLDALNQTLIPTTENAELKGLLTQVTSAIEAHLAYAKKIGEKVHASK
jgi:putative membrane protein